MSDCETIVPQKRILHVMLLVKSSQVNFICVVENHKFASKGFTICTTYGALCPKTLFSLGKAPQKQLTGGKKGRNIKSNRLLFAKCISTQDYM